MSNPGKTTNPGVTKLQLLQLTGNPTVDAVIRYGLVAACAAITGVVMGWLNRAGFNDPDLVYYVAGGVATVLLGLATAGWGIVKASKNETIAKLREAIGVQAGIAAAEAPAPTPQIATVADAQKVIEEHAPPPSTIAVK